MLIILVHDIVKFTFQLFLNMILRYLESFFL